MPKAFISYSRKDASFAHKLVDALQASGMQTWIDWDDIPPTADWKEEVNRGIEESDIFLIILSKDSTSSAICQHETEYALQNNKRLIPLVITELDPADVPPALVKLNWIFFRERDDFDAAMQAMNTAICTDLEWVETHRRLQVRALEWEKRKSSSLLLRGNDLRLAEEQLTVSRDKDPQPTDLQRQFLLESRRHAIQTRNRVSLAGIFATLLLAVAAYFAFSYSHTASDQSTMRATAEANAVAAQAAAVEALEIAQVELRQARVGQVSARSELLNENAPDTALLLALEAARLSTQAGEPLSHDTYQALRNALAASDLPDPLFLEDTGSLGFSLQGQYMLTQGGRDFSYYDPEAEVNITDSDLPFRVYDISQPAPGQPILAVDDYGTSGGTILPDGQHLVYEAYVPSIEKIYGYWVNNVYYDYTDNYVLTNYYRIGPYFHLIDLASITPEGAPPLPIKEMYSSYYRTLEYSPYGRWLTTSTIRDGRYVNYLIDLSSQNLNTFEFSTGTETWTSSSLFTPDNRWMATQHELSNGVISTLFLFDLTAPNPYTRKIELGSLRLLGVSPDSHWLVAQATDSNHVQLIDLTSNDITGSEIDLGEAPESGRYVNWLKITTALDQPILKAVNFSPDGRWLVMSTCIGIPISSGTGCDQSGTASFLLWDLSQLDPTASRLEYTTSGDVEFVFSPDSRWLATANSTGSISLHDLSPTGQETLTFTVPASETNLPSLQFNPDGHWLAVLDTSGEVSLLDLSTASPGSVLLSPEIQNMYVQRIAFDHNGSWMAGLTASGSILLWDTTSSSNAAFPYTLSGAGYNNLAFSADDRWLVASGANTKVTLWHMDTAELLDLACQAAGRNLTPAEWQEYGFTEEYRATCEQWPPEP